MIKANNKNMNKAKKEKNDEFYTQLEDIENELKHYKSHFKDKIVYCNCDDPTSSNFSLFFKNNFKLYGIKELITTCYKSMNPDEFTDESGKVSWYRRYVKSTQNDEGYVVQTVQFKQSDGDFRSDECIQLLKYSDIVVTNPPFSLFREYVAQLVKYNKKFLIIGHQNAVKYKDIFPLIKDKKIWLGYGFKGGAAHFINHNYENYATATDKKEGMIRVSGVHWFTNLDHTKRNEKLILYNSYTSEDYPKYDNFDIIEIDKVKNIPMDYDGEMGVPITFIDKYNPEQFEIIKLMNGSKLLINGKNRYDRIIIKRK